MTPATKATLDAILEHGEEVWREFLASHPAAFEPAGMEGEHIRNEGRKPTYELIPSDKPTLLELAADDRVWECSFSGVGYDSMADAVAGVIEQLIDWRCCELLAELDPEGRWEMYRQASQ